MAPVGDWLTGAAAEHQGDDAESRVMLQRLMIPEADDSIAHLPVLSSSKSLKAFMISSFESLSPIFAVII